LVSLRSKWVVCGETQGIKVRQILKNFGSASIIVYGGRDESAAEAFNRARPEHRLTIQLKNAMRKALESESNRLTISTRPAQVPAISGTVVLALALLFVMAVLGAAFLLLQ
jgi:UDP-N-acetylmuramoylalanine-D-glutamate ligase